MPRADAVFTGPAEIAFTRISLRTELACQVSNGRFERRFRNAHHVVIGQHARRAEIGQRDHRAALGHQGRGGARHRDHRICADFLCQQISGARGFDERAIQILAIGEGDAVDHRVQASFLPKRLGEAREIVVFCHVAIENTRRAELRAELLDGLLQSIALIR